LTLDASSVTGNTALTDAGGGIYNDGTTNLKNGSRVTGNTAPQDGGGIANAGTTNLATGSIVNGNEALNPAGVDNCGGPGNYNPDLPNAFCAP
jgi:hypothetical protein